MLQEIDTIQDEKQQDRYHFFLNDDNQNFQESYRTNLFRFTFSIQTFILNLHLTNSLMFASLITHFVHTVFATASLGGFCYYYFFYSIETFNDFPFFTDERSGD